MRREIFNPADTDFLEDLYRQWKDNPGSVPEKWDEYFRSLESGINGHSFAPLSEELALKESPKQPQLTPESEVERVYKQTRVDSLLWAYRDVGYIHANLNPLEKYSTPDIWYKRFTIKGNYESLSIKEFGLDREDLEREFSGSRYLKPRKAPLKDILQQMEKLYCSKTGYEFLHIQNKPMRRWLIEKIEKPEERPVFSKEKKRKFHQDLIKAEQFESFIQSNFIGQKRFSLEGAEVLVPALSHLISASVDRGIVEIAMGMSHRGRLNVLTNVLKKPASETFAMFIDNYQPQIYGGSGDVKYHIGYRADLQLENGKSIRIGLASNPSHLESIDPVVEGKTRGIQALRGDFNRKKVLPVLIHGDAAFSGQGVVAETLNLSQLPGYRTGGTVHIIINNQIGFTTASRDARSTFFCTDVVKSMPFPIIHVNGDYPEEVLRAVELSLRFRQKFGHDAIVDIICYRRRGHNEADEPSFTHPIMYDMIKKHPGVRKLYAKRLTDLGIYSSEEQDAFKNDYKDSLTKDLETAKKSGAAPIDDIFQREEWKNFTSKYSFDPVKTSVSKKRLDFVAKKLTNAPEGFSVHSKLKRFLSERCKRYEAGENIDWSFAESLAFGTILLEGHPIRLSGEDCQRGTFSQRHAVWWDTSTEKPLSYAPLKDLSPDQGRFAVYDSPLSEFSVLGFDYGYSLNQPNSLVIWEAQFGDFANGAQVIIDQFVTAGEKKWFRPSGLVMLLPHGYEGQGPEHSSGHLERYLQLSAEENIQVCNLSTPAQYFHLLRKQIKQNFRKPLIIMSPKSLLRHKAAVSKVGQLAEGGFGYVIDDPAFEESKRKNPDSLCFCSGKIYFDLSSEREKDTAERPAIIRIEQLYPFPEEALRNLIETYSLPDRISWVQEEPANRGAWTYIHEKIAALLPRKEIEYIGRAASASPATGSHKEHEEELERILSAVFRTDT